MIYVRRTWTCGQIGLPKTKASKGPVPLHRLLGEFMTRWKGKTAYPKSADWVFPSLRLKGKQPRVANMLVEDYLRPAAADWKRRSDLAKFFGMMVARDGIEPPTPAFSDLVQPEPITTYRFAGDCQVPANTRKTAQSWAAIMG